MSNEPSKMTVLDNTDLNGIIQDATGEPLETPEVAETKPEESKEEPKVEAKEEDYGEDFPPEIKEKMTASMKKAIGKKHRQAKEAEEFAQDQYNQRIMAERRAQELEEQLKRFQGGPAQEAPQTLQPPDRNQFASEDEYLDAKVEYKLAVRLAEEEARRQQIQAQAAYQQMVKEAENRIAAARKLVPDFDEVCSAVDAIIPDPVANYMQASPMFAELGYHLAKNPEIIDRLAELPPMKQLVEIGKIEAILKPFGEKPKATNGQAPSLNGKEETPKPANGRSPRQAPAPITPLNTASGIHEVDESGLDYKAARERWAAKNRVNITRRARH